MVRYARHAEYRVCLFVKLPYGTPTDQLFHLRSQGVFSREQESSYRG